MGLSKYVGMAEVETHFAAWVEGYAEGGGRLSRRELELVPELIELRVLNNVAYFVGRFLHGEDSIEPLVGRAATYRKRCEWIARSAPWMREVLKSKLMEEGGGGSSE